MVLSIAEIRETASKASADDATLHIKSTASCTAVSESVSLVDDALPLLISLCFLCGEGLLPNPAVSPAEILFLSLSISVGLWKIPVREENPLPADPYARQKGRAVVTGTQGAA